jgi:hypothetical protein
VVNAKEKRVDGGPRKTERLDLKDRVGGEARQAWCGLSGVKRSNKVYELERRAFKRIARSILKP